MMRTIPSSVICNRRDALRFSRPTNSFAPRRPLVFDRHPGIAKRYPGPSDFAFGAWRKSLDPGFRRDDGNRIDQHVSGGSSRASGASRLGWYANGGIVRIIHDVHPSLLPARGIQIRTNGGIRCASTALRAMALRDGRSVLKCRRLTSARYRQRGLARLRKLSLCTRE